MKNIILNEETLNKNKYILPKNINISYQNYDELITKGFELSNDKDYVKTRRLANLIDNMIKSRNYLNEFMHQGLEDINDINDKYKDIKQDDDRLHMISGDLIGSYETLMTIQGTLQRINIFTDLYNDEQDFRTAIRNKDFLKAINIILTKADILKEKLDYIPEYIEKNLYYHNIDEIINIILNEEYQTPGAISFLLSNLRILLKNGGIPEDDRSKVNDIRRAFASIGYYMDDNFAGKKFDSFVKNKNGNASQKMSKQGAIGIPDAASDAMPDKINDLLKKSIRIMLDNNAPDNDKNKEVIINLIKNSQQSEKAITVNARNGKEIREKDFDPDLLLFWSILIGDPTIIEKFIKSNYTIYRLTPEDSDAVVEYVNNLKFNNNYKEKQKYLHTINFLLDKGLISPSYAKKIKIVPFNYKSEEYKDSTRNKNKREKRQSTISKLTNNDNGKYEESKKYELNTKAMKLYEERKNESFSAKKYSVKVKHDYGTIKFMVIANSEDEAKKMVMKHENCPLSAIISVKEIGTLGESGTKDEKKKLLNVYHYFIKEKTLQYMFKIKSDGHNIPGINNKIVSDDINKIKNIILHAKDDINIITPLSLGNNPIINEIPNIKINRHAKKLDEVNYNITNPEDANGQSIQQQLNTIKSKGYNPATDNIIVDKTAMVNSSKTYTKGQIKEMRFNKLFENSKVFTKKELLKNLLVK
jgi:hypothetical protein